MPLRFGQYQRRFSLFDGSSGNSSTFTSSAQFVGDYAFMTVSWATDTTAASRLTLQGTNEDGFRASLNTWSNLTGITQASTVAGLYTIDTGFRWIRAQRGSEESLAIVDMFGRT